MTLEQIEIEMNTVQAPGRLAELRVLLSAKYAAATNQYEAVLVQKPTIWNEMRGNFKSDTACERAWEATELGIAERHWKFQIKKIERMMSAIKTMIEVKTGEARNLY
jgi:hypothetical protein